MGYLKLHPILPVSALYVFTELVSSSFSRLALATPHHMLEKLNSTFQQEQCSKRREGGTLFPLIKERNYDRKTILSEGTT